MCLQYNYNKAHIVAVFIRTSGQKVLVIAPARTSRFWRYPVHCILSITFMLKDILMYQDLIRNELNEAAETLANFLKDDANIHAIQRAAVLLADSFKAGGKVLSCGNGGSHC
ncbi:SIS domain-containing protein, partial [Brevibacillus laterosporus]